MLFQIISALVATTAVFIWLNHRTLQLPGNVALPIMFLVTAFFLLGLELAFTSQQVSQHLISALGEIDFSDAMMHGMLAFLLFAGAVTIKRQQLRSRAPFIAILATAGVIVNALLVAVVS